MKVGRFGLGFKSVFHITGRRNLKKTEIIIKSWVIIVISIKLLIACSRDYTLKAVVGILHFCNTEEDQMLFRCERAWRVGYSIQRTLFGKAPPRGSLL